MQIIVNGEPKVLSKTCNLAEALLELGYQDHMPIAVAVNNKVIAKKQHVDLMLTHGNVLEILLPMQGG